VTGIRLQIEQIFDLPARGGLIAAGRMLAGSVTAGLTLRDQATGATVRVIRVEMVPPPPDRPDQVAIIVDRKDSAAVRTGATLVGD
jgi:hypothetical protein